MILHSIRVRNWRCILGELSLEGLPMGVSVVFAPNGSGKSSLFEALRAGLLWRHDSSSKEVKDVVPWGRDLSPEVTVEFSAGGTRYRVSKRFLKGGSCLLERMEDRRYLPLAEGPQGVTRTLEVLGLGQRGGKVWDPASWGALQALWIPQGGICLGTVSDQLEEALRRAVTSQAQDPVSRAFKDRLQGDFRRYFTDTGRESRKSDSPRHVLRSRLEERLKRKEDMEADLRESEALQDGVAKLTAEVVELEARLASVREEEAACGERAERFRRLESELTQVRARRDSLTSQLELVKDRLSRRARVERRIQEVEAEAQAVKLDLPGAEARVADLEERLSRARSELASAREGVDRARLMEEKARDARRLLELRETISRLQGDLLNARAALGEAESLRERLGARRHPSDDDVREARELMTRVVTRRAELEAFMITLEMEPRVGLKGRVTRGEGKVELTASPGERVAVRGTREVEVLLEGFGLIRASGPGGDSASIREDLETVQGRLTRILEAHRVGSVEELEALGALRRQMEGRLAYLEEGLEGLLRGSDVSAVEASLASAREEVDRILSRFPLWAQCPPDPAEEEAKAGEARDVFVALEAAEGLCRELSAELSRTEAELKGLADRGGRLEEELRALGEELLSMEAREELARRLGELQRELDFAAALEEDLARRMADLGDPEGDLRAAAKAREDLEGGLSQLRSRLAREEGQLEALMNRGLYSQLASLEEEIEDLRRELAEEDLRARALDLLMEVHRECQEEMWIRLGSAVGVSAMEILRRMAPRPVGRLVLDRMSPARFSPGEVDSELELGCLSGGEIEQVHFAVRLALGLRLAALEDQLLVMDDALMATDRWRLEAAVEELKSHRELQVLILTCHPERYAPLGVPMLDLQAVRAW